MLGKTPRRMQLAREWPKLLHASISAENGWAIVLPFCETLRSAFDAMCPVVVRLRESKAGRCVTFLATLDDSVRDRILHWHATVGQYVALRDCLLASFALDYDREGGAPNRVHTRIGELRLRAKPYDGAPSEDTRMAADQLIQECVSFLRSMTCYEKAEAVVAMPPSKPDKLFDLPRYLANGIAREIGKADLSHHVVTVKERPPLKDTSLAEKLGAIQGTISIDRGPFQGRTILLIDDLYQSGISMNYVAMELLQAGAKAVLGLACEKTCRNDDNVGHTRD